MHLLLKYNRSLFHIQRHLLVSVDAWKSNTPIRRSLDSTDIGLRVETEPGVSTRQMHSFTDCKQQIWADHNMLLYDLVIGKCLILLKKLESWRIVDKPLPITLNKQVINILEQRVSEIHRVIDRLLDVSSNLIELLILRLNVVVISKEWEQRVRLNPFTAEILIVVTKESTHVRATEWNSEEVEVQKGTYRKC